MIIFLGDSITKLGNWKTLLPEFDIANYGIVGNKIYQIINSVDWLFNVRLYYIDFLITKSRYEII